MGTLEIEKTEAGRRAQPARELKLLEVFVGKWNVEGENLNGFSSAETSRVSGEQTYEWLPGGYFLVSGWDRRFSNTSHRGLGIISYDALCGVFYICNYDNLGYARKYQLLPEGNVWHLTGDTERGVIQFSADGKKFEEDWESSEDGVVWKPLCTLKGIKVI